MRYSLTKDGRGRIVVDSRESGRRLHFMLETACMSVSCVWKMQWMSGRASCIAPEFIVCHRVFNYVTVSESVYHG